MNYLKLIHWPSLLLIVLGQFLIKYTLLDPFGVPITLNWFGLALLSLATVCLAAGGHVIQAIYTTKADQVSNPKRVIIGKHISIKKANKLFFIFNIAGVLIGFYIANIIGQPSFSILFIMASALLYAYATSLKNYILIGPLIRSLLAGLTLLAVGLFDLWPAITDQSRATITTFFLIILDYSIFISLLNFVRELVVNQRNLDGDHKSGNKTLPLVLGKERTNKIIFLLALLPLASICYYISQYLYMHTASMLYAVILLILPLFYVLVKILNAKYRKDYAQLNIILKAVMVFSILSIGLYQFILL